MKLLLRESYTSGTLVLPPVPAALRRFGIVGMWLFPWRKKRNRSH
jgi:hypothetical protein